MHVARRGGIRRVQIGMGINPDNAETRVGIGHFYPGNAAPGGRVVATENDREFSVFQSIAHGGPYPFVHL